MHPSLRLGLVVGVPVISAIVVVVSWRIYRRWRNRPALKSAASAPQVVQPKKEEPPICDPPKSLKEIRTSPVSFKKN